MHTVRNRIASRPSSIPPALAENKPPVPRSSRQELARLPRKGMLSAAPVPDPVLALPAAPLTAAAWPVPLLSGNRSSTAGVTTSMAVTDRTTPAGKRQQKRRKPKGKKARKSAARKAAMATVTPKRADTPAAMPCQDRQIPDPVTALQSPLAASAVRPEPVAPPTFDSVAMLEFCLQAEPALALTLPARPEPLVEAPDSGAQPDAPAESAPALFRVTSLAEMPEQLVAAPVVELPVAEMPVAKMPAPVAEPLAPPAAALAALAALANAQSAPLPRSRALVSARRQGLVDVLAFLLRDSGRRLARWSARRHKSRAERDLLRRAEARQHALVSELEALDALRRRRGGNRG